MVSLQSEPLLSAHKCISSPEFKEKILYMSKDCAFEFSFLQRRVFFQIKKLKYKWVMYQFQWIELFRFDRDISFYYISYFLVITMRR